MSSMAALSQVGDLEYSYDVDGRVIEKTGSLAATGIPSAVSGNTFNLANEMTAFNGTHLSYDLNGNLLNDGTNTYTWDARNHLATLTGAGSLPTTASFIYDALGRRAEKTINQQTTAFLCDGWNPVQELLPSGLGQFAPTANMLTGLGIDEFFQRADANGAQSFISDALGSALVLTNPVGSISTSYTYEPFGTLTNPSATDTNPFQFTGRENDGTGLYFYRARYYSFAYQRFIAQDPRDFLPAGPNLYVYTSNQPTNFLDPSGERLLPTPPIENGPGYFPPAGGEDPVSFPGPELILPNPLPLPPGRLFPVGVPVGPPLPPSVPSWNLPPARCFLTGGCKCFGAAGCTFGCGFLNAGDEELGFPACEASCGGAVDRSCEQSFPCGER
jgi:RHS repeat-associated protein